MTGKTGGLCQLLPAISSGARLMSPAFLAHLDGACVRCVSSDAAVTRRT